jgi:hypothetical protein
MKKFMVVMLALYVLMMAIPVAANAQTYSSADSAYLDKFDGVLLADSRAKMVWVDVVSLNKPRYQDIDLVQPGDTILMPLNHIFVARSYKPAGRDHMWSASEDFVMNVIDPYVSDKLEKKLGIRHETSVETNADSKSPGWKVIGIALFIIVIYFLVRLLGRDARRIRRSFVPNPPRFEDAKDEDVQALANSALQRVYGIGHQIIGQVLRGHADGDQVVFNNDGRESVEHFKKEEAWRALVRFSNGVERWVVSKWSCFNPFFSAVNARFRGTFTPLNGEPVEIDEISEAEIASLNENIRHIANGEQPQYIPAAVSTPEVAPVVAEQPVPPVLQAPAAPETPSVPEKTEDKKVMHLTKLQISADKGLNMEGQFDITTDQLDGLISKVINKGEKS